MCVYISVNHWAPDCPDKNLSEVTCLVNKRVLHQNHDDLKSLVSETWNSVLRGASSMVCGMKWFKQFKGSITESDKRQICLSDSKRPCRFGDGKRL